MIRTLTCVAIFLTALASAASAQDHGARTDRQTSAPFNLVNATADSVTSVALASSGSDDFTPVDMGGALTGGLNAVAFQLPAGPCLRDMQVTFTHQRVSHLKGIDVCRTHGLRLDSLKGRMMTPDTLANDGPADDRIVP